MNGKESTYNRKMGRQLWWESFVASKVWSSNTFRNVIWSTFPLAFIFLQFKFKDFNANKVGNHEHNVLGTHKIWSWRLQLSYVWSFFELTRCLIDWPLFNILVVPFLTM
jgi:hypothetical protein